MPERSFGNQGFWRAVAVAATAKRHLRQRPMSSKSPIEMLSISAFVRMLGNSPEIYLFAVSSYHPLFPKIANLKLKCKVEIIYRHCHNEYLELADFLFSYEGHDLGELISLLREFIRPISTRAEGSVDQLACSSKVSCRQ
jgi:hypothetical protein